MIDKDNCAQHSPANWGKSIPIPMQREAEWFADASRTFAAWCAWWQAWFGIPVGVVPFAGACNAWWWGCQDALPFAGVV